MRAAAPKHVRNRNREGGGDGVWTEVRPLCKGTHIKGYPYVGVPLYRGPRHRGSPS